LLHNVCTRCSYCSPALETEEGRARMAEIRAQMDA
jgi:hypothetical protein